MKFLLNEQHKWIAEYFDFTSRENAIGIDGAISQQCGEAEAMPIFECKLDFLMQHHIFCPINQTLPWVKSILNQVFDWKKIF